MFLVFHCHTSLASMTSYGARRFPRLRCLSDYEFTGKHDVNLIGALVIHSILSPPAQNFPTSPQQGARSAEFNDISGARI